MSTKQKRIVIDLTSRLANDKLYSRLVWQELFNIYRNTGGYLSKMDNMLCDLYSLERDFKTGSFVMYWYFTRDFTVMQCFADPEETCYKIAYNADNMEVIINEVTK